ncbi:MAG: tetratricopeptide repeat protein [Kofleriaceae bacterium]|nr:tetratricopeptide repeat protein [Kofleriaceae bacterium]
MGTILPIAFATLVAVGCGGAQKQHAAIQAQGEALRGELAELYVSKGAREAAVPLLQRMIAQNPSDVRARVLYGSVLRDLGLYPQAEAELRRALKLDEKRADGHAALAILLDLTSRHPEALDHHRRATQLAPGNADYRNNLGFSLLAAGEHTAAIAPLETALALDPGMAPAYANLGYAYGRSGRFEDAERTFRAGMNEASALLNLSLLEEERGDHVRANELRERAYTLSPDLRPTEQP